MSDHRSPADKKDKLHGDGSSQETGKRETQTGTDPLELIEQCLASFSEDDPRQKILYKLRHAVMLSAASSQQREAEFKKISEVVAKLTAELGKALADPGVKEGLQKMAVKPGGPTGDAFKKRIDSDIKNFADVVKAANLTFK